MAQLTLSDYSNNLFSNHFLEERIRELDEWEEVDVEQKFEDFRELYQEKKDILSESLNEDQTQDNFINPVLRKLGHDWVTEASKRVGSRTDGKNLNPDYAFMDSSEKLKVHRDDEDPLKLNYAVGDAKAWDMKLDKSSQDHTNPAFQIYNYVDRLRADWGLLTNGKKWRLYSYEKCAADVYFEVDLEALLSGEKTEEKIEAFKYFYLFFRADSFEEGFLEKVYRQSVQYNEELEDDLEDKVYKALEAAVEGFFETNDIEKTEEKIDLVHHSSLIFLYRILFILNAESRDLLPTEDESYRQAFGLTELKRMIVEDEETHIFQETTVAWDKRISRLFEGINEGYSLGKEEIPAYNGGLFDEEESKENQFLAENQLQGTYLKDILELLATRYDDGKEQRVIVDYKDLNIRHLGSVYEGLLEHQFEAADERKILKNGEWTDFSETSKDWQDFDEEKRVEENELYLTNESGERKATGSYYTPEYIVEYIVENTVGPKVEEKIEEAEENGSNILPKILELNVCDPAMGSGHFLTEATEFIAEHIVEHADLEEQDIDENEDELNWAKRQVVQNCIYGVDVNELAVELGKLSLWIETMAEGKPLNFLDHHLKHGNSLIGSEFDEIFSHPTEDQKRLDSERYQFGDPQEIKESFQEQYLEIEEMPENTVEQIHEKEQAYKQFIQENVLYQQFHQLANIHTRQYFEKEANSSDYESFLINIGNPGNPFENTEWYKNAQQDAENRNYFHWQLEFPKVFFGHTQGFDAVIGNPPYIRSNVLKEANEEDWKYLKTAYEMASYKEFDIYACFIEKGSSVISKDGMLSYILPNKFLTTQFAEPMRRILKENNLPDEIVEFNAYQVFDDVTTYTCVFRISEGNDELQFWKYEGPVENKLDSVDLDEEYWGRGKLEISNLDEEPWLLVPEQKSKILDKISSHPELSTYGKISQGTGTRADDIFVVDSISESNDIEVYSPEKEKEYDLEADLVKNCVKAKDLNNHLVENKSRRIIVPYKEDNPSELINAQRMKEEFPKTYSYLEDNREELESREKGKYKGEKFYQYGRPQNMDKMEREKLLLPAIVNEGTAVYDDGDYWVVDSAYFFLPNTDIELRYLSAFINSSMMTFFLKNTSTKMRGGYYSMKSAYSGPFPIPESDEKVERLENLDEKISNKKEELHQINLNIQDYLGNYSDGKTLGDIYSPVEGLSDKVVSDTSADKDSLRIGSVEFEERNGELILKVSARYKPDDSENIDEDELDRWGYFETEKVPAMRFDVDEKLRPLIEEFVSLAVDEAGGFAGFRESATKTNSVIDRLEKLTLPKLEDVEQGLEKFIENREEAEELEEEIQETDELIDAIVFDLYDLTEEEIETVLDSLDTSESEKASILEKFNEF